MAEIKPMALIQSMKKKVCMHSDVYFRTNTMNGKVYTGKLCYPSTAAPSADQTAAMNRFKTVSAAIRARIAALDTDAKKALRNAAKAAQAGSTFGYAFHTWNSEYDDDGVLITD